MKKFSIIIILISLMFFGCDRFDHDFVAGTDSGLDEFEASFISEIENLSPENEIEQLFSDDYLNNGMNKIDMVVFLTQFFSVNTPVTYSASNIDINPSNLQITWDFKAETESKETLIDTTIVDYLVKIDDQYIFYGDQAGGQKILVELTTSITCTYCPYAEAALHHLKQQYGSRLVYIEYHTFDNLDFTNNTRVMMYYQTYGNPTTIIQGSDKIEGATPEDIEGQIDDYIQNYFDLEPQVSLNQPEYSVIANGIEGSVQVTLSEGLSTDDLYLKYALMEDVNDEYHNENGDELHNVIIARGETLLTLDNIAEPVLFELTNSSYLPDDLTLVIWVQTAPETWSPETSKVHNVIEIPINN